MSKPLRIQILLVSAIIILYLATLTSDYYWDGITFALQIEKVASGEWEPLVLFHQNHLLYTSAGYLIYQAVHAGGFAFRALDLLQITNAILGGLAVGVFFRIAERILRNHYIAIVCAIGFAISASWWKLATDTDAYIPGILFMLLCLSNLLGAKPRWYVAGLALACAMLMHELASLIYPASILAVIRNTSLENRGRFAIKMSLAVWLPSIGVYYGCAALLHGITSPIDVLKWATSNPSDVSPSLNPIRGISLIPRANFDSIVGHRFRLFAEDTRAFEQVLAFAACLAIVILLIRLIRSVSVGQVYKSVRGITPQASLAWRLTIPVLGSWIVTYMVFLIFWEPWQVYYRTFYLPALALLAGLSLRNYHSVTGRSPTGVAALTVGALMLSNLAFYIVPLNRSDANELVAEARKANRFWNENTIIYFANRKGTDTAFEYFNESTKWRRLTTRVDLDSELHNISKAGGVIWLNKGAADSVGPAWLARHQSGETIELTTANARYVALSPSP